jgi:Golgi phosphoprotein 3 (GPP34)
MPKTPIPESLPARAYLLGIDPEAGRIADRTWFGYTLRAAALADLHARGHLVDDAGAAATHGPPPRDPVLRSVWDEVGEGQPIRWNTLIRRRRRELESAVREQLADGGWIRVTREPTRFRAARIEMRDPRALTRVTAHLHATLRGVMPISRADPRDAALVAVLAAGGVKTALPKELRRRYDRRIADAITRTTPVAGALKSALRQARSSAS